MKHKVSELEGHLLDAAVAKAEGVGWHIENTNVGERCIAHWGMAEDHQVFRPSARWQEGGPIIERERIATAFVYPPDQWNEWGDRGDWPATWRATCRHRDVTGPTPLIAAMRAYTASVFGEEVELP